jgi:phosphoribosylformylglycinamidine cyclo-ligase
MKQDKKKSHEEMTYSASGVDIDKGDRAIEKVKTMIRSTFGVNVAVDIGGFAGLFRPDFSGMQKPLLVASTDGVGTKLLIAKEMKHLNTIGIDLVAMIVNDIICVGAKPLFLLDYIAVDKLSVEMFTSIIEGIVKGCQDADCALIGGETAELPGVYPPDGFDLAAFGIGIVDEARVINGRDIREGDAIIGLPSSGFHSNGYSLVRKIVEERAPHRYTEKVPELGMCLGDALLQPTKIYVKPIMGLIEEGIEITGIANITGGGIPGNVPRILPDGLCARIDPKSWSVPREIKLICEWGDVPHTEQYKVFNMGIGMVLVMRGGQVDGAIEILSRYGIRALHIGETAMGKREVMLTN